MSDQSVEHNPEAAVAIVEGAPSTAPAIGEVVNETILTADGHRYTGELRSVLGIAGLNCDGLGTMYYTNGDSYVGSFRMNKRHGNGTATYADGATYDGEWFEDERHGCGHLTEKDGTTYEGNFKHDEKHGVGTLERPCGERYTGSFAHNLRKGRGILNLPDGGSFEGCFDNDAINGLGTMRFACGDEYVGLFKDNKMHGAGTYAFASGDTHTGEYADGIRINGIILRNNGVAYEATFTPSGEVASLVEKGTGTAIDFSGKTAEQNWKDGEGVITNASEGVYRGSIENGQRNGNGTLVSDNVTYSGEWRDGHRHGHGTLEYKNVTQIGPTLRGWRYTGDFKNDVFDGHGTMLLDLEGNRYIGSWSDGRRQGCGKEEIGGDVFEGEFDRDLRHGKGVLCTREGLIVECTFVNGIASDDDGKIHFPDGALYRGAVRGTSRHGEGRMLFANGDVYDGEYRDDKRHGVGMIQFVNKEAYQGTWAHDLMHGSGTLTFADGSVYEGKMSQGVRHGPGVLRQGELAFKVLFKDNVLEERTPL